MIEPPAATHPFLYKYRSTQRLDWLKQIVLDRKLYVPTANELNDPREVRPPLKPLTRAELNRFMVNSLIRRQAFLRPTELADEVATLIRARSQVMDDVKLQQWMAEDLHEPLRQIRVYSLAPRWDNLQLWAYYGDGHKGYCIEFHNKGLFKAARQVLANAEMRPRPNV